MNGFFLRYLKVLLLFVVCILMTGCELIELIEKAILNNGQKKNGKTCVTILVMPPFPDKVEGSDAIQKSFTFSKSVEESLMQGLSDYNSQSSSTKVDCVYWGNGNATTVLNFYRKVLSGGDCRVLCAEQLNIVKNQYKKYDASCVIFGIYTYRENATSMQVQLIYYDAAKRQIINHIGSIPILEGRDRKSRLADLMTNLLKKIYK